LGDLILIQKTLPETGGLHLAAGRCLQLGAVGERTAAEERQPWLRRVLLVIREEDVVQLIGGRGRGGGAV